MAREANTANTNPPRIETTITTTETPPADDVSAAFVVLVVAPGKPTAETRMSAVSGVNAEPRMGLLLTVSEVRLSSPEMTTVAEMLSAAVAISSTPTSMMMMKHRGCTKKDPFFGDGNNIRKRFMACKWAGISTCT